MPASLATFQSTLQGLINNFQRDLDYFRSKSYLEAQAGLGFINPLFEALDWDVPIQSRRIC